MPEQEKVEAVAVPVELAERAAACLEAWSEGDGQGETAEVLDELDELLDGRRSP